MSRPLTDRERCLALAARVAELEDELAAWRANDNDEARWARLAGRVTRMARALRRGAPPSVPRRYLGLARVLIEMLDRPGQVRSYAQIYAAMTPGVITPESNDPRLNTGVYVCWLRKIVGATAIETARGQGYMITTEAAPDLKARFDG